MPVQQSWLSHCSSSHVCHWLPASLLEHQGAAFSLYTLPTAFVPLWVGNTRYNVKLSPFRKAITKSQTVGGLSVWVLGWSMGRQGNFRLGLNLKTTDQRISKGKIQLATKWFTAAVSFALYMPGAAEAGRSHTPDVVVSTQQQSNGSWRGVRVWALKGSCMESATVVRPHCPSCGLAQVSCISLLILVLLCLC